MNRRFLVRKAPLVCFALGLIGSIPVPAQENAGGYNAFRTVRTRNIFDPQRRAMRTETTTSTQVVSSAPQRPNYFALTGAMVAHDRALAFFAGSQSDYNKVLRVGETIAGFNVAAVSASGVELAREGKTVALQVGQQIAVDGPAAGVPSAFSPDSPGATAAPPVVSVPGAPAPAPGTAPVSDSGGDKSDILKRMMERREKEVSK